MKMILILTVLLSAILVACSTPSETPQETQEVRVGTQSPGLTPTVAPTPETTATPVSTPLPSFVGIPAPSTPSPNQGVTYSQHSPAPILWRKPPTVEYQMAVSDVIVLAQFVSAKASTTTSEDRYWPAHILKFTAIEYLRGTGPNEFAVEIGVDWESANLASSFETEADALEAAKTKLTERDTQWDEVPGLLFLDDPIATAVESASPGGASGDSDTSGTTTTQLFSLQQGDVHQSHLDYSFGSLSRGWLPARPSASSGASGSSDSSGGGSHDILTDSTDTSQTISLADLKAKISEYETWIAKGDGSEEYKQCVDTPYIRTMYYPIEESPIRTYEATMQSGLPKGTSFHQRTIGSAYDSYDKIINYLVGEDASFFEVVTQDNDTIPENGHERVWQTTRPVPAGTYSPRQHSQTYRHRICGYKREYDDAGWSQWTITVTAPDDVVHEVAFTPSPADSGDILPAGRTFTLTGGTASIKDLDLVDGWLRVYLDIDSPLTGFDIYGHHLEVINENGHVILKRHFGFSLLATNPNYLAWPMESVPWKNGDKLMLRLVKSEFFEGEGATPTPEPPTPEPPTEEPTEEPTPEPPAETPTPEPTPEPQACFTTISDVTANSTLMGTLDDTTCKAHHKSTSYARYYTFSLDAVTIVAMNVTGASGLYISTGGEPTRGWGTPPNGTYEDRIATRKANGKLVHDGAKSATLALAAGDYFVEVAGVEGLVTGSYTLSIGR